LKPNDLIEKILGSLRDSPNASEKKILLVHSSLSKFKWQYQDYIAFIEEIESRLNNYAVGFPSFTYSSKRQEKFTKDVPPDAQNGSLSRVVFETRKSKYFRTADIDYSYIFLNFHNLSPSIQEKLSRVKKTSFGPDSDFSMYYEENSILLALGEGLNNGFTPIMHIEALAGVPYREFVKSENLNNLERAYYQRKIQKNYSYSAANRKRLLAIEKINEYFETCIPPLDRENIFMIDSQILLETLKPYLEKNPMFFLDGIDND
jgi:aminoglycoside N3'-acetyltransferase